MSTETPTIRPSLYQRLATWVAPKAAVTLAVVAILAGIGTYATLTGAPPVGPDGGTVLLLLNINFVLLLVFGAVVAKRLVEVWAQRRRGLAGSRLHIRLVVLFSAVAVTPTIIVAISSYLFLSFGMESWFSEKVRTALSESRAVAQAYLEEHQNNIRSDALAMAADLNNEGYRVIGNPLLFHDWIEDEVARRSLSEALIFHWPDGRILARSSLSFSLEFELLPPDAVQRANDTGVAIVTSRSEDRVRALVKLEGAPGLLLYVGRPVDPRVLNHLAATNEAVDQYERLEGQRSGFQIKFILIFGAAALLLLLAAVWVGLNFATQISRRISGLVVAAEQVRAGDLSARVADVAENDEFGSLSRAFNRMTGQLESQQSELVEANRQLDLRRRFTEAVLSGVSAGVIGLDEQGLIHLPNRSSSTLLGIEFDQAIGRPLAEVVPEMAALLKIAFETPDRLSDRLIEGQLRILTRGRAMVLLIRISSDRGQGGSRGFVVTFDDITELLGAQRKAAWADVARRIAHEMKNPLTPIQLSAERLKKKYLKEIKTDPETFAICTDTIIRQVGDIGRMVDEFSSFARMPAPSMKLENLQEITRQAAFLQRTAHGDITFDVDLPADAVEISCDSRQISQALINLLQNAIDSIEARQVAQQGGEGGSERGRIRVTLSAEPMRTILMVEDNGKGLPRDGRENLTEPYVTTRTKGTGLGLAIVKKIMEDHAGELLLEDGGIGGALVSMVFPTGTPGHGPVGSLPPARRSLPTASETPQTEVTVHGA